MGQTALADGADAAIYLTARNCTTDATFWKIALTNI